MTEHNRQMCLITTYNIKMAVDTVQHLDKLTVTVNRYNGKYSTLIKRKN